MTDDPIIPDFAWYSAISSQHGLPPRCPYATVERCPRYYQSLSLLGSAGSTQIDTEEDKRLLKLWEKSDLWPRTSEYETSILSSDDRPYLFSKFCPEILYDRFGYFASHLGRYADEIDSGFAHQELREINASRDDPRWQWSTIGEMHYTKCPLYSSLTGGTGITPDKNEKPELTLGIPGIFMVRFRVSFQWVGAVRRWMQRRRSGSR